MFFQASSISSCKAVLSASTATAAAYAASKFLFALGIIVAYSSPAIAVSAFAIASRNASLLITVLTSCTVVSVFGIVNT